MYRNEYTNGINDVYLRITETWLYFKPFIDSLGLM